VVAVPVKEVGEFDPIRLEEWVPEAHVHRPDRHARRRADGDPVLGRRVLQYNNDVEIGICVPKARPTTSTATARATRSSSSTRVRAWSRRSSATLPYRKHDYVVIPRGTTYRFRFDEPQRWLTFYTPGEIETPNRYRNRYGSCSSTRRSRSATSTPRRAAHAPRARRVRLKVRVRGGYQDYVLDYHPLDVVGWDGYVYPYTFNIHDFEPKAGRCTSRRPRTRRSRARTS
jgi:homogentisate 1,2-dioxygenase